MILCMNYEGNAKTTKFEPRLCVTFAQTKKIGTHEYKATHNISRGVKSLLHFICANLIYL